MSTRRQVMTGIAVTIGDVNRPVTGRQVLRSLVVEAGNPRILPA